MLKKILKRKGERAVRAIIVISILIVSFLPFEVKAGSESTKHSGSTSTNKITMYNGMVFNGMGNLESINSTSSDYPKEREQSNTTLGSAMIDGKEHELSTMLSVYNSLSQGVGVNELKPGDYVGFINDPSGKIQELRVLKTSEEQIPQKQIESRPPSYSGDTTKNANGVWTN
ncbi:MAG: hypothetical protein V2B20_06600 [Pseudomonadota bacterium]